MLPWLRIIDGVLGVTDVVRWARGRQAGAADSGLVRGGRVESRLTGVVMAALKEAFDRDHDRLELERQHMEEERRRAERAMQLELLRQAGERQIGLQRLISAIGGASLLVTLWLSTRAGGTAARVMLGFGGLLLVGALAAAFSAQVRIGQRLGRGDDRVLASEVAESIAGTIAPWLIVIGLLLAVAGALLSSR